MYDTDCIGDMKADFLETMARSKEMRPDRVLLRGWERLPAEMMKVFSPLFKTGREYCEISRGQ